MRRRQCKERDTRHGVLGQGRTDPQLGGSRGKTAAEEVSSF